MIQNLDLGYSFERKTRCHACILCLSAGCSITWFNTVCFVLCIQNFPNNQALALSLATSFNSVSAALYNLIATHVVNSKNDHATYLLLNAFLPLITSIAALFPILQQPDSQKTVQRDNNDDTYTFLFLYVLAVVTGLYLLFLDMASQNMVVVAVLMVVLPTIAPGIVYGFKWAYLALSPRLFSANGPSFQMVNVNDSDFQNSVSNKGPCSWWVFDRVVNKGRLTTIGEEHTVRMLVTRFDFWLYYLAYFCGGTIGVVYSNNLGQISQSFGLTSKTTTLVTLFSTCSFFGRLISAAPDFLASFNPSPTHMKRYSTRTGWLALFLVPMPVAFLVLVELGGMAGLGAATGLIGLSSGFIFSAAVSITSELFGSNSTAVNQNIVITNIPLGSLFYGLLAALDYDKQAERSKDVIRVSGLRVCVGRRCYLETFGSWGCVSLLGWASSFLLYLRTRAAYHEYFDRKMELQ